MSTYAAHMHAVNLEYTPTEAPFFHESPCLKLIQVTCYPLMKGTQSVGALH